MADISERVRASLAGRYTIERELGRGGMATVYLARDLKHDRPVALKVLRPELAAVLGAERFLREIRLTAQLQHPHILTLIDSGEADGFLYYVMPYVEGESLRQRLEREGQLQLDEALRITRAIASALDFAHGRGVIHRDIKPENILLHQGEPMVADFGIALAISSAGRERLTETGLSLGTPAYMSPEQASAEPKLDGRSDQYSLASVLYEMLAGEPPYTGPTAQAIIAKRLGEPIPHLRTVRHVSPEVNAAVSKALAKAPADRFATAGAFVAALTAGATPAMRQRWRSVAAITVVLTAALAGGWGLIHSGKNRVERGRRSLAVLPFVNLSRDSESDFFGDGLAEEIASQLGQVHDLKVIAHTSALQFKGRPDPPRAIGEALGVTTLLEGSVLVAGARLRVTARLVSAPTGEQIWADEYERDRRDVFAIQRDIAERIVGSLRATLSPEERTRLARQPTADAEAHNLYLLGRYYFGKGTFSGRRRSVEYFEQAIKRDSLFAPAYAALADALVFLAYLGQARPREVLPQARADARRAIQIDSTFGDAYASLGVITAAYDWDWKAAEALFRRALTLSPNSVYAHMWYSFFVLSPLGRHDDALAEMRRALDLDPVSLEVRYHLGVANYMARRYDSAIVEYRRALDLDQTYAPARDGLGFSYAAIGVPPNRI